MTCVSGGFSVSKWIWAAVAFAVAPTAWGSLTVAQADGGRVTRGLTIHSPTLGREIPYTLYEPPISAGKRRATGARPMTPVRSRSVLYLLHGHGDDETAWLRHGRIKPTLDALAAPTAADGRRDPLVVVMPGAGNSWYVDDSRGAKGFGAVARALTTDFIAGVEARHGLATCRERRAIGGLSMGGYGAILYAFEQPETFAAAISLSGSLFSYDLAQDRARRRRLSQLFGGVFGEPFALARFNAWNVFPKVARVAEARRPPAVWLAAGDDDFPAILNGTVQLHIALRRHRIDTQLRIDDAGHTWSYWRRAIVPALAWLAPLLRAPCAPARPGVPPRKAGQRR